MRPRYNAQEAPCWRQELANRTCSDTTLGTTGKDLDLSEAGLDEAAAEEEEECAECSVGEEGEGEGEEM